MSVVTERMKWRRPRKQLRNLISETDQSPKISSMIQSTRCKSTISSFFSSFSHTSNNETTRANVHNNNTKKKKNSNRNFPAATFRRLGCTAGAPEKVSVPAVIRSSAEWQGKKKKNRKKKQRKKRCDEEEGNFQAVWCGPGIGFSISTNSGSSVDCVVARKKDSSRGKLDSQRMSHRERGSYFGRRKVNTESISFLNEDGDIFRGHTGLESFGTARFYRHLSHPSPDDLAEIMILQARAMGARLINSGDQFREWRLDIDNMSYEQLRELSERIGYVNTGLKEDEMGLNIRKFKLLISNDTSNHQMDKKCSICQEDYESNEELGRLNCEHSYHFQCIKQWLMHKNFCPVCKQEVVVRH